MEKRCTSAVARDLVELRPADTPEPLSSGRLAAAGLYPRVDPTFLRVRGAPPRPAPAWAAHLRKSYILLF